MAYGKGCSGCVVADFDCHAGCFSSHDSSDGGRVDRSSSSSWLFVSAGAGLPAGGADGDRAAVLRFVDALFDRFETLPCWAGSRVLYGEAAVVLRLRCRSWFVGAASPTVFAGAGERGRVQPGNGRDPRSLGLVALRSHDA